MKIFDAGNGFVGFGSSYIPKGNISINMDGLFLNGFRVTFFNTSAPLSYGTFLVTEIQKADNSFCTDLNDLLAYVLPIFQVSSGGGGSQNLQSVLSNGNISDLTIQLEDTIAGTSTTYKSSGMETVEYIIDMIDGSFLIQGPQGFFNIDNSGNKVEIIDFDEFRYSYASNVVMSVNAGSNSVVFNTDSFSVGTPVFPNIFGINGLSNTVSFDTSVFDVESDVFRVGTASFADMFVVDGLSGEQRFETDTLLVRSEGAGTGIFTVFQKQTGSTFVHADNFSGFSGIINIFGVSMASTGAGFSFSNGGFGIIKNSVENLIAFDIVNDRIIAYTPIVQTDTIGKYIPVLEANTNITYALRLDTII